ncbi:deoxyguanosinetriphosphate triphosphohydrolase [Zavarzinella formosa]|uniref:deoxyguanosinetriphosphate triphosphohydrolase n=1 Tax=Zavarzinella formosa TaxID=360055 RepID=UPI0003135E9F|nr:deoxyguanosinetriphosphate triphosphohydrolase [Zavarzinella formosa]
MNDWSHFEETWLAPHAMRGSQSRGRQHLEEPHPFRTVYQRDRERIVHCTAFRRMLGKTQVHVGQINDHHRTRLTHTLEVAQISRTIARRLRLNEDLTEAIALSHDMGHPPFGHAGEQALNECLRDHGGFDHNLYGLRRVDLLEARYPEFPGLNLSWELREAFVQHSKRHDDLSLREFWEVGSPLLEAQLVDAADSLAYDTHDTDDALGIGLISLADLDGVRLWREVAKPVREAHPGLNADGMRTAVLRDLIARQVLDLIVETERRLAANRITSVADVRAFPAPLVGFSPELIERKVELERFLRERVYRHHRVVRMAEKGKSFLRRLFEEFVLKPDLLPERHLRRWTGAPERSRRTFPPGDVSGEESLERVVADYLAGMTDRFAGEEYARLFHPATES